MGYETGLEYYDGDGDGDPKLARLHKIIACQALSTLAHGARLMIGAEHAQSMGDGKQFAFTSVLNPQSLDAMVDAFALVCSIYGIAEPFENLTREAEEAIEERVARQLGQMRRTMEDAQELVRMHDKGVVELRADLSRKIIRWRQEIVAAGALEMTHAERRGALQLLAEQMYNDLAALTREYSDIPF